MNSSEWSFYIIAPANSMLRQYDTENHILFYPLRLQKLHFVATVLYAYLYKIINSILQSKLGIFYTYQ